MSGLQPVPFTLDCPIICKTIKGIKQTSNVVPNLTTGNTTGVLLETGTADPS
jgi:hypothetical protein